MKTKEQAITWHSVKDKLPQTYDLYDNYGNDVIYSDPVITNKGVAVYRPNYYNHTDWVEVDIEGMKCGSVEGVTHWTEVPEYEGE